MNRCSNERMIPMNEPERMEQGAGEILHPDLISSVNQDMPDEEML